jgi:hypothetical protein
VRSFIHVVLSTHSISVPAAVAARLKQRYLQVKFKNFEQVKAASELSACFAAQGITLIPYKGALFAEAYYTDWAARESVDVDFLIAEKDVKAIERYFADANYSKITGVPRPYLNYYVRYFKDLVYIKPGGSFSLEMHWRLMERFSGRYPSFDFFAKGLQSYRAGSFPFIKLLPTYDFLAVVSNHFVKDMCIKFKYLIDVAVLLQKEQSVLNQDMIVQCAKNYKFEKRLMVGLKLVDELLGISFMPSRHQPVSDDMLQAPLSQQIQLKRLYINELSFIKRCLQLQDNFAEKVKFLLRSLAYGFLPTYADINELKLPPYLLPVLAICRPFRLLYKAFAKPNAAQTGTNA